MTLEAPVSDQLAQGFGPVVRQPVWQRRNTCLVARKHRKEEGSGSHKPLQGHIPQDLGLPTRPHLLKFTMGTVKIQRLADGVCISKFSLSHSVPYDP